MSRDKRLNHAQEVVGSIPISSCKVRGDRRSARLSTRTEHLEILEVSGQVDLNHRPHGPEPCALTRLSYAPRCSLSQTEALYRSFLRNGSRGRRRRSPDARSD